jgi:hypothetical protein
LENKDKKALPFRDLYVVCFKTKNSKANVENEPRCIECEVVNKKINKKDSSREIVITKELNFDKEME